MRTHADRNGPRTRQEILNSLQAEPGLTKSQLCRLLDLSWSTISHHVRLLEAQQSIERRILWGRTRWFVQGTSRERIEMSPIARNHIATCLLFAVVQNPGIGIRALSTSLSIDRRAIRRHLDLLIDAGLVAQTTAYRPQFFVIERARATTLIEEAGIGEHLAP